MNQFTRFDLRKAHRGGGRLWWAVDVADNQLPFHCCGKYLCSIQMKDWLNFPTSLLNVCISEDRLHMTLVINRKQSICQYGIFYNITLIYSRKKDKIKKTITKKSLPHELPLCRPFWTSEGLLGASEGLCTGFSKLFASSKWKSV